MSMPHGTAEANELNNKFTNISHGNVANQSSKPVKCNNKVHPPYDTLTEEQQLALYYLLEYFAGYATDPEWDYIKIDAANYLEKATRYFGLTKQQAVLYRTQYQDINKIIEILKHVTNKQILDYMVNNTYNLLILSEGDKMVEIGCFYYNLWEKEFGYSRYEIKAIQQKYMYRTDI